MKHKDKFSIQISAERLNNGRISVHHEHSIDCEENFAISVLAGCLTENKLLDDLMRNALIRLMDEKIKENLNITKNDRNN